MLEIVKAKEKLHIIYSVPTLLLSEESDTPESLVTVFFKSYTVVSKVRSRTMWSVIL